jgi:uncharacterized protein (TIGR00288 family)
MSKAAVFIDGGNWYFKLKEILALTKKKPRVNFDIQGFCAQLIGSDELASIHYYIGKLKRKHGNEKSEAMYAKQQKLIGHLQHQSVQIGFGHLISYPDGIHHEKGVDVLIAVEMIRFALEDAYDVAYLVSSDNDLVPAVQEVQRIGKKVVYVGSSIRRGQSFGLTSICDKTILLQEKDVESFLPIE